MIAVCKVAEFLLIGCQRFCKISAFRERHSDIRLFHICVILLAQFREAIGKSDTLFLHVRDRHHRKAAIFEFRCTAGTQTA